MKRRNADRRYAPGKMREHLLPIIYAILVCTAQHLVGLDQVLPRVVPAHATAATR